MQPYLDEHLLRVGHGEPLLAVHGIGHRKEAWDPMLPGLAGSFDVAAIDLPGFGGAPMLDSVPTTAALADHCEAVMDALGWDTAHVIGNSLGGAIALQLGGRGRARSVTAISPGGRLRAADRLWAKAVLFGARAAAKRVARVNVLSDTGWGRRLSFGIVSAHAERATPAYVRLSLQGLADCEGFSSTFDAAEMWLEGLGPVTVPTTIAWGTNDLVLPLHQGRRWAESLPGSRLVTMPGMGHTPMADDPDLLIDVVRRTAAAATTSVSSAPESA